MSDPRDPPNAGELHADFEKRFPGGTVVRAEIRRPAEGFSITALFGASGCGKTTALRCLAGLERPEAGHIRFAGETWSDAASGVFLPPQRRGIGFLFQDYALFPHLTVEGNIGYGLAGLPTAERRRRAGEMMEALRLTGLERRYPSQLSGGQQQRVALARAVARRPRLLLLDEPLSALDAPTREGLRVELRRRLAEFGIPAIIVTHDRTEALAVADHVVVLGTGTVLQSGPVHEVFARPAAPAVAHIVGVETVEPGRVVEVREGLATVQVGSARLTAVAPAVDADSGNADGNAAGGGEVIVCIRGEDVILHRGTLGAGSPRNRLDARVTSLVREGAMVRVGLDCGFPLTALVTRPASEELGLREGDTLTALLKAPSIHLIRRG
jgi:molybdate transport system ATP-binding protein